MVKTKLFSYAYALFHSSHTIPYNSRELFQRLSETSEILCYKLWLYSPQKTENYFVQIMAQKILCFCRAAEGFFPSQFAYYCQSKINWSHQLHVISSRHVSLAPCFRSAFWSILDFLVSPNFSKDLLSLVTGLHYLIAAKKLLSYYLADEDSPVRN